MSLTAQLGTVESEFGNIQLGALTPASAPAPPEALSLTKDLIDRVPGYENRLTRFTEKVAKLLNEQQLGEDEQLISGHVNLRV